MNPGRWSSPCWDARVEISLLSSRFSSADLEEIVTGVIESGQVGGAPIETSDDTY